MTRICWPLIALTVIALHVKAQSSSTLIGARANGMAYASSCLKDEWAIFNNVGGLSSLENTVSSFTYDAQPLLKAFNRMAAVVAHPLKHGVAGLGMFRFGDELYSEQILTAGYANRLGIASLGMKLNCIQYHAEGFGNKTVFTLSFGGIAQLTKELSAGAHIININQPRIATADGEERVPTILIAGLGFKASEKIFISSEAEKDIDHSLYWKTGLEYLVHNKLSLRTGFAVNPDAGFIGLGFKPKKFALDYAFKYDLNTGSSHQGTVSYKFIRK